MADGKIKKIPCAVYSRIVGYFGQVQNWNKGKQQEFADRRTFRPFDRKDWQGNVERVEQRD